jgi:tetraacyldisaccharide 4'-kinase
MSTWLGSLVWSLATAFIRLLSAVGILRPTDLGVRVISVGNIQAGGAGKTPLVGLIAREASQRGLRVCILSRGYGGHWEKTGGVISPEGPLLTSAECGDEPVLLRELAPQAWIGVGADRVRQFEQVKKAAGGFDLVLLDDGFQHWRIKKDLEIVAVTGARPSTMLFRDFRSALSRAHLIVWTKGPQNPESWKRPWVKLRFQLGPATAQLPLVLVTGLADGASAFQLLRDGGYRVERHISFPDHARYDRAEIDRIMNSAREKGLVVAVTGKDWVKWRELGVAREDVLVFEPEPRVEEGRELWEKILWARS